MNWFKRKEIKEERLELKKKVMAAMVRESSRIVNKSAYETLEKQYKLLGGCKEDLKYGKEE